MRKVWIAALAFLLMEIALAGYRLYQFREIEVDDQISQLF